MRAVACAVCVSVCFGLVTASAAPDAGAKARGSYDFYARGAHNSFSSARSHVEGYQGYLRDTHAVALPAHVDIAGGVPSSAVVVARPGSPETRAGTPVAATSGKTERDAVDPEIAREAGDAIGDDIERIQRHLRRMRAHAEAAGDRDAIGILDGVERNLAVARRGHAELHAHHASDSIAPATAMALAQKVNDSLRAAHAQHDALMKRLHESDDAGAK